MNDGGGTGRGDGLGDGVEDGNAFHILAALAGGDSGDDLGAVGLVAQPVVLALPAGESLNDHLGVGVDEDGHLSRLFVGERDGSTSRFEHGRFRRELRLRDAGSSEDLAALLGVRPVETDHDRRTQLDSAERLDDPLATSSPRVMPPKMLMKMLLARSGRS